MVGPDCWSTTSRTGRPSILRQSRQPDRQTGTAREADRYGQTGRQVRPYRQTGTAIQADKYGQTGL